MLELINRCLRTFDFCHVGEFTKAGIFVHCKGCANSEWKLMHKKLTKNLFIGRVADCTSEDSTYAVKVVMTFDHQCLPHIEAAVSIVVLKGRHGFVVWFSVLYKELLAVAECLILLRHIGLVHVEREPHDQTLSSPG